MCASQAHNHQLIRDLHLSRDAAQDLEAAHSTAEALERQQQELRQERVRALAWTGRALLGSTLASMLEARTLIRTAFLLPQAQMQYALAAPCSRIRVGA